MAFPRLFRAGCRERGCSREIFSNKSEGHHGIRARTSEGRERAKARGVTLADIARTYNVSAATISRLGQ
jgi:hypothetical protein